MDVDIYMWGNWFILEYINHILRNDINEVIIKFVLSMVSIYIKVDLVSNSKLLCDLKRRQ